MNPDSKQVVLGYERLLRDNWKEMKRSFGTMMTLNLVEGISAAGQEEKGLSACQYGGRFVEEQANS